MLGDFHAPVVDLEDLSPGDDLWLVVKDERAALQTGVRAMSDDLVWGRDLPQGAAAMTELSPGRATGLLSQRTSPLDLYPRRIERGRSEELCESRGTSSWLPRSTSPSSSRMRRRS